jgi:subtilisin family serine protease
MSKSRLRSSVAFSAIAAAMFVAASSALAAPAQVSYTLPASFAPGYSTAWLAQIGVTSTIEYQANGGKGFVIGFVDTGVVPTQADIAGRVSPLSSCAALTFRCSNGYYDDNGHGTATAAIAAGGNVPNGSSMAGVAPGATILSEKVLNASGSGYDTDVANGILKAVNAGAGVINLSLTYIPSAPVVSAINTAAGKGDVVVFAGGNSSAPLNGGANSTGLTAQALTHLVFVGSVSSKNQLSSFSNTPGTGYAVAGATKVSYASLWLVAPGENIVAPGIQFGPNALAYWTGTSMAAPMVSGALALLESTWPILTHNGTATSLLFATATDLGAKGVDPVYGAGLLNVTRAFQPVGALTVTEANGQSIPVTQLTGTMVAGGALGSLSGVTKLLSSYTVFDSFARNFYANLSPLLTVKTAIPAASLQLFGPVVTGGTVALPNGASAFFARADGDTTPGSGDRSAFAGVGSSGMPAPQVGAWLLFMDGGNGTMMATGRGFSLSSTYAETLWGSDSASTILAQSTGHASDLLSLASGGQLAAFGTRIGEHTRIAFGWSNTQLPDGAVSQTTLMPHAMAASVGITTKLADGWSGGATIQFLHEGDGLLGSVYNGGALGFGHSHRTTSFGLSTTLKLGPQTDLVADATIARTNGVNIGNGLIAGTSGLLSRSADLGLVEHNVLGDADEFSFLVSKPLSVFDGSIGFVTTSVDAVGLPATLVRKVGLSPDGSETDLYVAYSRHFDGGIGLHATLGTQFDAGNVRHATGGVAQLRLSIAL